MKKISLIFALVSLVTLALFGCKSESSSLKKVVVACSPTPHAEIMNEIKGMMQEKGFELVIKEFNDYVQPNIAVNEGSADANYFQHLPYLEDFNAENGTKVVSIVPVHYEPFGLYAGSKTSLDVAEGDKIAVPNDVTNEARALNLLQDAGIIKLKDGVGLKATKLDILENPYNVVIEELESAQIPRAVGVKDVALACMNGNYAVEAGYKSSDALYLEKQDSVAATTYANIVCVKEGNENADFAVALKECIKSDKVKTFIDGKYEKSVIYIE